MSSPFPQASSPPEVNPRKRGHDDDEDEDMDPDVPSSRKYHIFLGVDL
jgi:DNA replication licensing factor MCM2